MFQRKKMVFVLFLMANFACFGREQGDETNLDPAAQCIHTYHAATAYRMYPITVWWKECVRFVPYAPIWESADVLVNIHHLAGNIKHISRCLVDKEYYQSVRRNEWSQSLVELVICLGQAKHTVYVGEIRNNVYSPCERGATGFQYVWEYDFDSNYKQPSNLVEGRDCLTDLKAMIAAILEFDELSKNNRVDSTFRTKLEKLESESAPYRKQRKIEFKAQVVKNKAKCGIDDSVRSYLSLTEDFFTKVTFERGTVSYYPPQN